MRSWHAENCQDGSRLQSGSLEGDSLVAGSLTQSHTVGACLDGRRGPLVLFLEAGLLDRQDPRARRPIKEDIALRPRAGIAAHLAELIGCADIKAGMTR